MKIAFVYPAYWPYVRRGVERCLHDLTTFLAKRGHDVHLITSTPGAPRIAWDEGVKVTYLRQFGNPLVYRYAPLLRVFAFGAAATAALMKEKPDVLHLWSYSGITWGPLIRRMGIPYVFHVMMPMNSRPGGFGPLVRGAEHVLALTGEMAKQVEGLFGVPCKVVPPPVDMDTFRPCAPRNPARPIVFFPADLADPRKGGSLLLRAWNRVHRACPEAVLVLGGPYGVAGWHTYHFGNTMLGKFQLVRDPAARAAIELRGPGSLDSLPRWYSEASVTVLPSVDEAFGMVLTESLACGTPVVASAYGGPGEILRHPGIGTAVELREFGDLIGTSRAQELADAILGAISLSRQPETSERCRTWASQWSLERIGLEAEQLLESAAQATGERIATRTRAVA